MGYPSDDTFERARERRAPPPKPPDETREEAYRRRCAEAYAFVKQYDRSLFDQVVQTAAAIGDLAKQEGLSDAAALKVAEAVEENTMKLMHQELLK